MALTEFSNAFFKTPVPMVPSTKPSSRPLRFLPSRTTTTSMSDNSRGALRSPSPKSVHRQSTIDAGIRLASVPANQLAIPGRRVRTARIVPRSDFGREWLFHRRDLPSAIPGPCRIRSNRGVVAIGDVRGGAHNSFGSVRIGGNLQTCDAGVADPGFARGRHAIAGCWNRSV
jgi:hypothetical protein